jgi:hypothetical protein
MHEREIAVGFGPSIDPQQAAKGGDRRKIPLRVLAVGGVLCLVSWIALAAGIFMNAGFTTMFVPATVVALATEGLVWLTAVLLGTRAFKARRYLLQRVRGLIWQPRAARRASGWDLGDDN